jgi:DNA-directed RNA polymerase specialized sigma24 family protein
MYFSGCSRLSIYVHRQVVAGPSISAHGSNAVTDATFVARLQRNDYAAYDQLVDQYGDILYRYIYESTRDHQQSAALLGAAFVRVVDQIGSYTADRPLIVWLHRIAQTVIRDTWLTAPSRTQAPEALDSLSLEERQVIVLRCVVNMSVHEIGYVLAKSNHAVKQLQFQALRAMYDWLK